MSPSSRTYLQRIFHVFSTRTRAGILALVVLFSSWLVTQFVLAEQESHIYIFPSTVTSEGWDGDVHALTQDLSSSAVLSDFTVENSAYLFFGEDNAGAVPSAPATSEGESIAPSFSVPVPSIVPEMTPPSSQTPPSDSGVTSDPTLPTNGGGLEGSETVTPSPESFPASLVPVFPTPEIAPVPLPEALRTPESEIAALFRQALQALHPRLALAEDLPVTAVSSGEETDTVATDESATVADPALVSSPEVEPTPISNDPYTVLSCTTSGAPCHFLSFVGFGMGGALADRPILSARLELSLAGRGDFEGDVHDRLIVRAYHAGRWEYLGETEVKGEFSNAKRGGYLSYDLPDLAAWGDLSDLKVVVEYLREGGASDRTTSVVLDGIWVNATYATDALSGATPEELALSGENIRSGLLAKNEEAQSIDRDTFTDASGETRVLTHADTFPDAKVEIKTDRAIYHALGKTTTYFRVTNLNTDAEVVRLQFHLPVSPDGAPGARVTKLSRYSHSIPYKVGSLKYDALGYFCAPGWASSSPDEGDDVSDTRYQCSESGEYRTCDSLNADGTNCITEGARVGLSEDVEYRSGWTTLPVIEGSFRDDVGLFRRAIDLILGEIPSDAIPASEDPVAFLGETIALLPGQTVYFSADLDVPLNSRGDFYVEAAAESGSYGLVRASWDGSWNYRVPVDIAHEETESDGTIAIPVVLDRLPESFWSHVDPSGKDIRFADAEGDEELPYWIATWDYAASRGLAWVRIPAPESGTSTRIFVYGGDHLADSFSDPSAPFRTDTLTPRAVVFGKSQEDMTLHAIALADDIAVSVGGHPSVTLAKGESALFTDIAPGAEVRGDGPLALSVESPGDGASVVPIGYAGLRFVAPGVGGDRLLSLATEEGEGTHVEIHSGEEITPVDPVYGSIVGTPLSLTSSHRLLADRSVLATIAGTGDTRPMPLYPSTEEDLYGFGVGMVTAGFGENGGALSARCGSSGALDQVDGRRAGASVRLDHCDLGVPALADVIRIERIATPLAVVSDDTKRLHAFLPKSEFAPSYALPEDVLRVFILCAPEDGEIPVGIFDPQGTLVSSTTCAGYGARPGKAMLAREKGFVLGSSVRTLASTSAPFLAGVESVPSSLTSDETSAFSLLSGAPLARSFSPNHPTVTFGEEEFVIPGEHRKLDLDENGKERDHVDVLLSEQREFTVAQDPGFRFRYTPQSNSLMQGIRDVFGAAPFRVMKVSLLHPLFGELGAEYDIAYGEDNTWTLTLKDTKERFHPGKYTLHVEIEEGRDVYVDEYDFYWGVLAINYQQSVFTPGETARVSMAALSDNGNTICGAAMKLWVVTPAGEESEIPVVPSEVCNGNTVIEEPDYTASYAFPSTNATGTYALRLVRFDENGNVLSQVTDTVSVVESVPLTIERDGPTRIYPVAHYPMRIRVTAHEDFSGTIVERLPGDFVVIDRGGADLKWGDDAHTFMTASWTVDMKAGQTVSVSYVFDAPDRSPYLYLLGPAQAEGNLLFTEHRLWQIASDAVGQLYIYWDQTYIPAGWNCVSCTSGQTFYQRFVQGSTTYNGVSGGSATDTPTVTTNVYSTASTGVGPASTVNTTNAPIGHIHPFTPTVSGASNLPTYRELVVLQWGSSGEPASLPTGAIVAFDVASSSLPSGWNRYVPLDGRYVRGAGTSTIGTTGGANTHNQTLSGTLPATTATGLRSNGTSGTAATLVHTHTLTATTTNTQNTEPPYVEVLFAKLTATGTPPNTMIGMWDNTPPSGWVTVSGTGGTFDGKFMKATTTYGGTGGTILHTYNDIIGAVTGGPSATANFNANAANAQAPNGHTHTVDFTGFSTTDTRPPYVDLVFAKRVANVVFWTQSDYRFYVNANANTPTDPWPLGASDIGENSDIDASTELAAPGDVLRLRMNLLIENATASPATAFKLQYAADTDCANALNWSDVAPIASSTALWRGYNNTSVTDGAVLSTTTLSTSNVAQSYIEANPSPLNPATTTVGQFAEWDWVVEDNLASAGTNYCFRMIKSDNTPLDTYTNYPQVLTNTAPTAATLSVPFNNEKVSSTLPDFHFVSSDNEADDLDYEIVIDADIAFGSPDVDADSSVNPELFDNLDAPTNKAPFSSGNIIHFAPTSALTNGTTYWWRVRAKDAGGSNSWGAWSRAYSFTVDTSVVVSTWFQSTHAQFLTDTFSGATTTGTDDVVLITGSTTGTLYSSPISFSLGSIGTAWGRMKWNSTQTNGIIAYQVEYQDQTTGSWSLVPDVSLAGNSTGFTGAVSSTSLLTIDSSVYATLRLRANFTNVVGTPYHLDWGLEWGYKVTTPGVTAPFDNAKVATTTPTFTFSSSDPQSDKLVYQVSWSTTTAFTSSSTRSSDVHSGFIDVTTSTSTNPFNSGDTINFTIQSADAMTNGTTYYYRIRARDPLGANDWSFWSDTRSLTVDTSIIVATWYQTDNGQFLTDTFTSVRTVSIGSTTVATSTDEAMFAYGEGTEITPKYRIWDGTSWGTQRNALNVGAALRWVVLRASPIFDEYLLGTLGTDRDVNVQVYNNNAWGNKYTITGTSPSLTRRSFDIAYETLSGRAIVAACDGDPDPTYAIWSGTSSSWIATGTINLASANNCELIRMASHPKTNEIILLARDTGVDYEAQVWNATTSSWGNSTGLIGGMTEVGHDGMAVKYEQSGDQAMVVVSNSNSANFLWSAWRSSTGTWSAATTQALGDDFESGNLATNPATDGLNLCYIDEDSDIGAVRWTGAAWVAFTEHTTVGVSKNDRPLDCSFENTAGRSGYIQEVYGDTTGTRYRVWTGAAWSAQASVTGLTTSLTYTAQLERTAFSNTILGIFFVPALNSYYESRWATSSWSTATILETSASVTSAPYGQPFFLAPKNPATQGTMISTPISFADGNAPAWDQVFWSSTTPTGATLRIQVEYYDSASSTWRLIPDGDLSGNSTGNSISPINIKPLNTDTYHTIRLVANFACYLSSCPTLHDWTVKWAQGINISGTAKQHDLASNVTSGTVAVAVNGVLQSGKTGTIGGGVWTISNVTIFPGNTVEVFTSGGATSTRAVSVAKYDGPGDFGGLALNERWVTIGSASGTAPSAITLTDLAKYDNSVSGSNDLFFDVVNATGDYSHCVVSAGCDDSSIYVLSGNTFRPATSTGKTITTFDFRLGGYLYLDANTLKVGASWRNLGGFTPGTGTILFNATSSTRSIDSTGAATSTFGNVTFGEAATGATWTFTTPFVATGTVAMNYGTTSPGSQAMTLESNLSIGANGTFRKGTATTTFSGTGSHTWTDSTAAKQDLGNISVNGTSKTVSLSSSVKATHVHVASGNTLNAGGANTMTVLGHWDNYGTFTPQSGTVTFATTTTGMRINQGTSAFYNLTFNGSGGGWNWLNTNATTTNDLTISAGAVTLPGGVFAVGGSFNNTGGTFTHNSGVVRMYATLSGKTIRASSSPFFDLTFDGAGGAWSFADTNATTSNTLTILAGSPTFPSGVLAVGRDFLGLGGSFVANGGTLKMTSTLTARTITVGGSVLANLTVGSAGTFTITDTNVTATGDLLFLAGTTTCPSGNLTVGGSFTNTGAFLSNGGTMVFNTSSGARTVTPGNSSFANVSIAGVGGSLTIAEHATTTGNFTLTSAASFVVASGKTLAVGGTFTNSVGGGATTWVGATLALNSGGNQTINTKTTGGDAYGTLRLGTNTMIRSWNSSSSAQTIGTGASWYSQNHGAVGGELDIFGTYVQSTGTDYWSYATDFDGTALGGSSRQVNVRFDAGASAIFATGTTLEMLGSATASTTVDRRSSGNYGITFSDAAINANFYQVRNMNATGLYFAGATVVTSLANGDYSLDVTGGSSMTVSAATIDANPALQIFGVKFATSSGVLSGYNVTELGDPLSYWRFKNHYGNYDGEGYDNDPAAGAGNPGYIRWDDSSFVVTITGTVYADAGVTPLGAPTCDNVTPVVRVKVDGGGDYTSPCLAANGAYAVSGVTFSGDTAMTIYLDTNGGPRAALVTRSAAGDLFGMNLYKDRVIVRHEDTFPATIATMALYDKTQDTDIPFDATDAGTDTLVTDPNTEFWVWAGMTFVPGGNITLNSGGSGATYDGSFHVDNGATFTAQGSESHAVGGRFVADAGAIFTAASSTFAFTATTSGKSITGVAPLTFWNMLFTGSGGNWSVNQTLTIGNTLTPTAGTISGSSNITVYGTSVVGSGAIAISGGTFTLANGGTFGGNTDWSFGSLTFGNGTVATTTKTGSSTVTISDVLTDSTAHTFQAGTSTTWVLTGGGIPFVLSGALSVQNATFRYAASGASAQVTAATYARLECSATGASSPTYTMDPGAFSIGGPLVIGNASGSLVTLTANTNDPAIVVSGDVSILTGATFVASDAGSFIARRNWTNLGTTTASGGTITFDATTTGFTINPGNSPFAQVVFNNASGGWTISGNATSTGAWTIAAANSFTLSPGKTLEVGGTFTNLVGGGATTWSGSTLYLNAGTTETINTKSAGQDDYATLLIGTNTQVRMWDSLAATTTTNAAGSSLYSQDHNAVSGALSIFGTYTHTSGNDYWSYATDFDGATGTARQVNVRIASSSTLTFSGGGLEVIGVPGATTTIAVEGSGAYALNVSGGTLGMRYYSLRNADASGLNISGTPTVGDLSDGDFELAVSGGTMMRVAGATIDANPLLTFQRNRFATSSGVASGYNVTAVGTSVSAWRFNLAYGARAGEAYDNDPGGDPGYLIWDDSAAQLVISGNVYSDEGQTPIGGPTCDGVTQNVRLKVQGGGSYASACNVSTGAYSISGVVFNPKDTLTVYLDTNGGAQAVNIAYDPATNIGNMHLYRDRIILRHEQGNPITISSMARYDRTADSDIPFIATTTATSTTIAAGTGLIVWNSKVFAPGGNVTVHANASGNSWDGTVHLYSTSTWSGAGSESYVIGGNFIGDTAASIAPANSTFTFTATTSGKSIRASTSLTFANLTLSGANGTWDIAGVGTTSYDLSITNGTTTLPVGTLSVGGSFVNTGGAFIANGGTIKFVASSGGKSIRGNGSSFSHLLFDGVGGGWTFTDTNATSTGSLTILSGTPTFPAGTLAIGEHFDNQGGTFVAGSGTLKLTSTSTNRTIRLLGSSLGNLLVAGSGTFLFLDQHATTTGDVILLSGTTTFPFVDLAIGGSFANSAVFSSGTSTVRFVSSAAGKTINPGNSSFFNVIINGGSGGFTITENATTTGSFSLSAASSFTLVGGKTLEVGGLFTNTVGGAATTWTGTLYLNSGLNFTMNTKSQGLDIYNALSLGANTQARMWGSSATTVQTASTAGLYSQNQSGVSGSLYIYGNYTKMSGTDYWSYATDFDGVALGGSSRQADVRFAPNATATYTTGASLHMIGSASASTTVDRQSSGNYTIALTDTTWNARYYQFRNMGLSGLSLLGTTTITTMDNGDFSLDLSGGTALTVASTTVDQNASSQIFTVKFATSSGVSSGYNVTLLGTTGSSISFNGEYGNFAGESFDNDGVDGCGAIRWSDSTCLISDQRAYRFRNDDGGEGALSSEWYDQGWTKRKRVRVTNTTSSALTNVAVKMTVTYDTDMQTSFQDLRFTDSSGTTSVAHWMEASTASTDATIWVRVPQLPASGSADIFMYYGNATATQSGVGTTTFLAFDDFEDGFSGYTGDTTLFVQSATIYKTNTYGLSASAGNTNSQNTDGIRKSSVTVGRDTTWHFWQYINMSTGGSDEPCFTFAAQSPVSLHQNYGVCLSPSGVDKVIIAKNVAYNSRNGGATELATTTVTYTTGWYEIFVDWLSASNRINVAVYTSGGALLATTSATDSTYTSGSYGFSFWYQHGGWDTVWANTYRSSAPTVSFGVEQADSGASWLAAENTYLPNYPQNQNVRLRFSVRNSSLATLSEELRLQVAAKLSSPNCESVPTGNYSDVPPTSSGCGSSPACMTTSTQFVNKASSTQLLSIPTGYTFTYGQIIEDPSRETDPISLPAAQFTEAEYNFQMTANAPLDRYCLRVVNATTPLDNYSRVAEIQVLHPPMISDLTFNGPPSSHIALTEGTTTMITATATVTDLNGYTDIIAASSTYYRSSISGGNACATDGNNCYQIATSSCGFSNCSGNTCLLTCSTPMWYFADPTDIGDFVADVWNAFVDVWDTSGAHDTSTANKELYTLSGLTVPSTINYGSVVVGSDTGSSNASTSVANTGNSILNLNLGGDFLKAGINLLSYNQQKYATSTFTYSVCSVCNALAASSTPDYYSLGVSKATSTSWSPFKDIFWGIGIPPGTAATTFTGFNIFEAMQ